MGKRTPELGVREPEHTMPDFDQRRASLSLFPPPQNGDENYTISPSPAPEPPTSNCYSKPNGLSVKWAPVTLSLPDLPARWHSPTRVGKTSSSLMRPSIQSMSKAM